MFTFKGYSVEKESATVLFNYELLQNGEAFLFVEKISFDATLVDFERVSESVLRSALETLELILGVSYWKLSCPGDIKLENIILTKEQAEFWNTVYTKGLGEFFYKNKIDFRGLVNFPADNLTGLANTHSVSANYKTPSLRNSSRLPNSGQGAQEESLFAGNKFRDSQFVSKSGRSLVLWGGGKDSVVTAELLKKCGKDFDLFSLNDYPIQRSVAKIAGKNLLIVKREIDPQLFELNKRHDVYNGHVPATFIYSAVAVVTALLYGYDDVIISCEESANYGNVEYLGNEINHQWSKSYEFEKLFKGYLEKYISPSLSYFSLLRSFHEIKIVEEFVKYPQYFNLFSSCNKNFTIAKSTEKLWCGECPKCAFVFALLAGFLPKAQVVEIFGKNLFEDSNLIATYRGLLNLEEVKPFDCVGTPEETRLAFWLAYERGDFAGTVIMKMFEENFESAFGEISESRVKLLSKNPTVILPSEFLKCI